MSALDDGTDSGRRKQDRSRQSHCLRRAYFWHIVCVAIKEMLEMLEISHFPRIQTPFQALPKDFEIEMMRLQARILTIVFSFST